LVDRSTRTDRYDLNEGAADSVDHPKATDPAAARAGQVAAEQFADCGIVDDVAQSRTKLSLRVRVETSDRCRDGIRDFQPPHDDWLGGSIGEQLLQGIELGLATLEGAEAAADFSNEFGIRADRRRLLPALEIPWTHENRRRPAVAGDDYLLVMALHRVEQATELGLGLGKRNGLRFQRLP
jgi:hypothetical protein